MTKVDCKLCENRGLVNGLSEDTFCSSCIHCEPWRKDYYNPAVQTITEQQRKMSEIEKEQTNKEETISEKFKRFNLSEYEKTEDYNKLKALIEGLKVENPSYWLTRKQKELGDLGRCIDNGTMNKIDGKILIDALLECKSRLLLLKENGRAKTLDIAAIESAEFALANVGVVKHD